MYLRLSGLRENSVLSVPVEGLGEALGQWGRRRRQLGLRDQKDLSDQSYVCVTHLQKEAGFVLFHTLSGLGRLSRREPHPYFALEPA